jgi:hypothetical protein
LLLALVPFLLYYLLMGIKGLVAIYQKLFEQTGEQKQWLPATALIWLVVALNLYSNNQYIQRLTDPSPKYQLKWLKAFDENEDLIKHVGERVPKDAVVATQNPALVYLYTGRKTVASDDLVGAWEVWKKIGVRYLARTSPYRLENPDSSELKFVSIYRTNGPLNLRLLDLGEVATRPNWKD